MSVQPFILTLSCQDRPGIVAAVSGHILACGGNITDSSQYNDADSGGFFMRTAFSIPSEGDAAAVHSGFDALAKDYGMTLTLRPADARQNVLILVSKFDHCLVDLLYRSQIRQPLHQHPPQLPARLQRGQALSSGACARGEGDWGDRPLRDRRSRRRADHRTGCRTDQPCRHRRRPGAQGPRYRTPRAVARGWPASERARARQWRADDRVPRLRAMGRAARRPPQSSQNFTFARTPIVRGRA